MYHPDDIPDEYAERDALVDAIAATGWTTLAGLVLAGWHASAEGVEAALAEHAAELEAIPAEDRVNYVDTWTEARDLLLGVDSDALRGAA